MDLKATVAVVDGGEQRRPRVYHRHRRNQIVDKVAEATNSPRIENDRPKRSNRKDTKDDDPRTLIPQLLIQFYRLGWVSGTGGGISIRHNDRIFIAPSGVQKERVRGGDLFVQTMNGDDVSTPKNAALCKSQCTPLFMNAYTLRDAGAVIHSHSKWANLVTVLYGDNDDKFIISHQEMIKGIRDDVSGESMRYDQQLVVPIIDNTCFEADLKESMAAAMQKYPSTCAVLVRRHGIYVWGRSWQQAKSMAECYDYLFEIACEMKRLGINSNVSSSAVVDVIDKNM